MNTKFFFFLLVSLLIANSTTSTINTKNEVDNAIQNPALENVKNNKQSNEEMPLPAEMPSGEHSNTGKSHNSTEEDGKFHYFHFNRLTAAGGRRLLFLFLGKLLLAVAHISFLIYCFMHVVHQS